MLHSSRPPVRKEASDHGGRGPKRRTATIPTTPTASTASEKSEPPAQSGSCPGSSAGPADEVLAQANGPGREGPQPVAHRRGCSAEVLCDRAVARPVGLGRQRGADHLRAVTPAHQGVLWHQHVGGGTRFTDRSAEAPALRSLPVTHLTLDAVTPGSEPDLAGRALEAAADQVRLDGGFVSPYDEHSGAPASSGRALSRPSKVWRGGSPVQVVLTLASAPPPVKPRPRSPSCSAMAAPPNRSPTRAYAPRRQTAQSCSTSESLNTLSGEGDREAVLKGRSKPLVPIVTFLCGCPGQLSQVVAERVQGPLTLGTLEAA